MRLSLRPLGVVFATLTIFSGCSNNPQPQNSAPQTQSSDAIPVYEGFLDVANCDTIAGWAWNKVQPNSPVQVDIFDGETKLGTVTADTARPDLAKGNIGNGQHGFGYAVTAALRDGNAHTIHARVSGTTRELGTSPKQLNCPAK